MPRPVKSAPPSVEAPSKTQRKKDMHSLQALGETLCALPDDQLGQLDLPEALRDALAECSRITRHEARRRHMQYIGKLMREVDPEPIRAQLDRWEAGSRANKAAFKASERWRERLITEPDALAEFAAAEPEVDREALARLIAEARTQAARGAAPAAARQVFRVIYRALCKL